MANGRFLLRRRTSGGCHMMIRKMEIEMNSDGKRSVEQKRTIGRRDGKNIGYVGDVHTDDYKSTPLSGHGTTLPTICPNTYPPPVVMDISHNCEAITHLPLAIGTTLPISCLYIYLPPGVVDMGRNSRAISTFASWVSRRPK